MYSFNSNPKGINQYTGGGGISTGDTKKRARQTADKLQYHSQKEGEYRRLRKAGDNSEQVGKLESHHAEMASHFLHATESYERGSKVGGEKHEHAATERANNFWGGGPAGNSGGSLEYLVQNLNVVKSRKEMLDGREHLVVPMTMIVPGVLNGSKGALYYPPEEVGKDPTPWNGMPITVDHPVRDGRNVSAQDPKYRQHILDTQGIGVVKSARADGKLRAEAWLDVAKANKLDPRVIENVNQGKPMEISTGLFTDNTPAHKGANHNGKPYQYVARNYRPDHLAILPDQKGACSVDDGCGLGLNAESVQEEVDILVNDWAKWNASHKGTRTHSPFGGSNTAATQVSKPAGGGKLPLPNASEFKKASAHQDRKEHKLTGDGAAKKILDRHEAGKSKLRSSAEAKVKSALAKGDRGAALKHAVNYSNKRAMQHGQVAQAYRAAGNHAAAAHYEARAQFHNAHVKKLMRTKPTANSALFPSGERKFVSTSDWVTYNKGWTQKKRDELPEDDFAGPHKSYPIKSQKDIEDAARLIGHADDPEAVKSKIKAIAKRKGLKIPASWKTTENANPKGINQYTAGNHTVRDIARGGTPGNKDKIRDIEDHAPHVMPMHPNDAIKAIRDAKKVWGEGLTHVKSVAEGRSEPKGIHEQNWRHAEARAGKQINPVTWAQSMAVPHHEQYLHGLNLAEKAVHHFAKAHEKKLGAKESTENHMTTTNAMEIGDHEKAAHRLSRHAAETSKASDDYEDGISGPTEKAVTASKLREHEEAGDQHLKAAQAHLDHVDADHADELDTHVAGAKAHQTAAASHYDVARLKQERADAGSAGDDSFGIEPDDEDVMLEGKETRNAYDAGMVCSKGECKSKAEKAENYSERAEKTDRKEDHSRASQYHDEAADAYMNHEDGPDTEKSAYHSAKAADHTAKGQGGGPVGYAYNKSTQDGHSDPSINPSSKENDMAKLTANQRSQIINKLTEPEGCGCYTANDREYLTGLSDERLNELQGKSDEHLTANSSGGKEVSKQLTDEEWMANAPPGIQAIVANGAAIMKEQKNAIITKLVANVKDEAKKTALTNMLSAKSLDEVKQYEEVANLAAPPVVVQARPTVYGPTGQAVVTDNEGKEDDATEMMAHRRIDWDELSKNNTTRNGQRQNAN